MSAVASGHLKEILEIGAAMAGAGLPETFVAQPGERSPVPTLGRWTGRRGPDPRGFVEPMLQREVVWSMQSSSRARQPFLAQGPGTATPPVHLGFLPPGPDVTAFIATLAENELCPVLVARAAGSE